MWSGANERWREGATPHLRMGPPLNGRSSHLIEAAKRGRLDPMIFFSAPLTTRAPPGRAAGRPAERPAGRPLISIFFHQVAGTSFQRGLF